MHDAAGRLLLIRRGRPPSAGSWSVPGGRCLPGESAADACVREVREETGLDVSVVSFAGRVERDGPGGVTYVIDDFVCRPAEGVQGGGDALVAGDDAADARWVTTAEMAQLPLAPLLADVLNEWDLLPRC